ncbi:hypothetical protein, partial [Nocardia farcinica]|uniref:hypothetical protein n=1 Tax=Nocardia farcinica TaxID=37329 RepID=UPI001C0F24CD
MIVGELALYVRGQERDPLLETGGADDDIRTDQPAVGQFGMRPALAAAQRGDLGFAAYGDTSGRDLIGEIICD